MNGSASGVSNRVLQAQQSRNKAILEEFDLEVESRCNEMEICAQRLKQNMRNEFRIHLMKLPANIRRMPIAEFCEVYNADVNVVVNAEEIKAKNAAQLKTTSNVTSTSTSALATAASTNKKAKTTVSTLAAKKAAAPANVNTNSNAVAPTDALQLNLAALQGITDVQEQLRYLQALQSQLDAYATQLKVAAK